MEPLLDAVITGAGMLWKALWALIFGYVISAGIQVLVTREQMARLLGERGLKQAALASFFGFVSSSCSFAALAASRSVLVKGAHPANALAFLIASQLPTGQFRIAVPQHTMYGHAICTMALCEAYGMTGDKSRLLGPAQRAINFIQRSQGSDGSWGYQPNGVGDTSIVGWQVQALQSARLCRDMVVDSSGLPALAPAVQEDLKLSSKELRDLSDSGLEQALTISRFGEMQSLDADSKSDLKPAKARLAEIQQLIETDGRSDGATTTRREKRPADNVDAGRLYAVTSPKH